MMSDVVLPVMADYVEKYATKYPEREAVIFGEERLTYHALHEQVASCAKAYMAAGLAKGDRVAVLCTSRTEFWVSFLAATRVGAIWLGLNPKYKMQELCYVLEDAKPKLVLMMAEHEGRDYQDVAEVIQKNYGFVEQVVALTKPMPGLLSFDDFLAHGNTLPESEMDKRRAVVLPMDAALLVYTSGSTGRPKGALLSHYGLCFGSVVQNQHYQQFSFEAGAKVPCGICCFPINHVASVADTCCVSLVSGGTMLFQERFDPAAFLQAVEREKMPVLGGVPTMLLMLLDHPDFEKTDLSCVNLIVWGGAALPAPMIERLKKITPHMMSFYGMTETAAHTTYTSVNADITELSETIGRPSPHMPCRIVNVEGKPCAPGEAGELQFKGDYLFLEYLNRPEASREAYTEDGWLHTGDVGYWREDGTISLVGRMSDMFKSGGYNVYPREIENLLESHPSVQMAAVVSVPDPRYQEVGAAFIVVGEGTASTLEVEELRSFCKENMANYKVPKHFIIIDEMPLLPVGKVNKIALKEQALKGGMVHA